MANVEIKDLTALSSVAGTEKIEVQDASDDSYYATITQVLEATSYIEAQSANYNVSSAYPNYTALVTAGSSADVTATLPDATTVSGYVFRIMKADTGTKNVIVATAAGNINSQSVVELRSQYDYLYVISDGTNYYVIDYYIHYDTGFTANSDLTDYTATITHNLNTDFYKLEGKFFISSDATQTNTRHIPFGITISAGGSYYGVKMQPNTTDTDSVIFQTGQSGVHYFDSGGAPVIVNNPGYIRQIITRKII